VHVTIDSTFSTGPIRTLSIEIPGRTVPNERIVMAAHVQEPGANDNASGVATLAETVVSLANAIRAEKGAAAGAHADVSVSHRDQRQPPMAAGPR
jgi:Zn-dependent M28 family amino/carboxypeptidase